MEGIIYELINGVKGGKNFEIDFEKRNMKVGNKYLVKEGKYDGELGVHSCGENVCLLTIEHLYKHYKRSTPSERNDSRRKRYFYALPSDKMTDEELVVGGERDVLQALLEGYVLIKILDGTLKLKETGWFYRGKDPDLIIIKNWITGGKRND